MVAVAKGLKRGPIKSRVSMFPNIFSMTNGSPKGTESRCKPRVRFRLVAGEFGDDWCMFIKQRGQSGIVSGQERSEGLRRVSNEWG